MSNFQFVVKFVYGLYYTIEFFAIIFNWETNSLTEQFPDH